MDDRTVTLDVDVNGLDKIDVATEKCEALASAFDIPTMKIAFNRSVSNVYITQNYFGHSSGEDPSDD
jgi:hypothetical protein